MHDGDKLRQAATSKLIRFKNKIFLKPFPLRVALMNILTKVATYFIYGTHINNIHKICEQEDSSTRATEHHRLP